MSQTITVPIGALQAGTPERPITLDVGAPPAPSTGSQITVPLETLEKVAAVEHPEPDEGLLGFARHVWHNVNPVAAGQLLPFPKALGGSGTDHPLALDPAQQYAPKFLTQMHAVKREGDRLWEQGDHVGAAAKYLYSVVPLLGPMLDRAGDELRAGKFAAGSGDLVGLTAALFGPAAMGKAAGAGTARVPPAASTLTAEELAANAFAKAHDVPLDAATATGSRFVAGVQKVAGESMLGAGPAGRARKAQQGALERVGGELASEVNARPSPLPFGGANTPAMVPGAPVSPEQAGTSAAAGLEAVVQKLRGQANAAYSRLRELEGQAEPDAVPAPADTLAEKGRASLRSTTLGYEPKPEILRELRRIRAELDAYRYEGRTWTDLSQETGLRGNAAGGHAQITAGHAGAPVYDDILAMAPGSGGTTPSRAEVLASIDKALETGRFDNPAKGAINVAELRLQGGGAPIGRLSKPMLPPEAGDVGPGRTAPMRFAVDMTDAKAALQPLYEQLSREAQIAPLMGGKADALRAIDRVIHGPDHAPLSVADAARSDLDAIARTDDPLFRSAGQGAALKAARALDEAVQLRAAGAGNEVYDALKAGRAATRAKYDTGAVLDQLRDEPVATFQKLTAPRDQNITLLREIQTRAPDVLPDLGRAKLQEWLDLATERGRFDHVDRIYAEWQKLGDQTKRILFRDPALVEKLDRFFLLAKRVAENPNPSGTAGTAIKTAEVVTPLTAIATLHPIGAIGSIAGSIGMGGLARLMYTPAGVEALTAFLEAGRTAPGRTGTLAANSARRAAALARLGTVAKAEGVPFPMDLAADREHRAR